MKKGSSLVTVVRSIEDLLIVTLLSYINLAPEPHGSLRQEKPSRKDLLVESLLFFLRLVFIANE